MSIPLVGYCFFIQYFDLEAYDVLNHVCNLMPCFKIIEDIHNRIKNRTQKYTSQMMKNDTSRVSILLTGL